jgi:hypothetical protein
VLYSSQKLDQLALSETQKIISVIEDYKNNNGTFPENYDQFVSSKELNTKVKFGILSTEIKFFLHEGNYFIEYYQAPLGPFYGYSFKTKEWYSTE